MIGSCREKFFLSGSELLARSGTVFGSDSGSSKKSEMCKAGSGTVENH